MSRIIILKRNDQLAPTSRRLETTVDRCHHFSTFHSKFEGLGPQSWKILPTTRARCRCLPTYLGGAVPATRGQPTSLPVISRLIDRLSHYRKYRWDSRARAAANCNVGREFAVVWNLRVSGITTWFHESMSPDYGREEGKRRMRRGRRKRSCTEVARRRRVDETKAARVRA